MRIINKPILNQHLAKAETWAADLAALFLPRHCAGCDIGLMRFEQGLCRSCVKDMPRTRFHNDPENPVEQLFWGKVRIESASAFLLFARSGMTQRMLHRLKYKKDREVGLMLGRMMAEALKECPRFKTVDTYLPVPLHPKKERLRGFNQSQVLVDGMCEVWPKVIVGKELMRVVHTTTQTQRGRLDRWMNVKEAFHIADPEALRDRHVLLVDDVVTTGATLEGCIAALSKIPGIKVSVFTAACA